MNRDKHIELLHQRKRECELRIKYKVAVRENKMKIRILNEQINVLEKLNNDRRA